ncbi:UNVERIFIED_CONTAM: hypothetical protein Sradi_3927100 [Sesamum radiatum]|uniref:Phytocyanin domain-containing protein n=1 Tax=Sesamum radiatum TaxID=300843 RepID=A0AAW2PFX6_SESRA
MTNQHDVVRVLQASYDAHTDAFGSVITAGPANFTLDSAGNHYYICTFGRHCEFGQKLAVTVVSSTPAVPIRRRVPPATTVPTTPSPASPNRMPVHPPFHYSQRWRSRRKYDPTGRTPSA